MFEKYYRKFSYCKFVLFFLRQNVDQEKMDITLHLVHVFVTSCAGIQEEIQRLL